jgi:hypothetical protein
MKFEVGDWVIFNNHHIQIIGMFHRYRSLDVVVMREYFRSRRTSPAGNLHDSTHNTLFTMNNKEFIKADIHDLVELETYYPYKENYRECREFSLISVDIIGLRKLTDEEKAILVEAQL